VTRSSLPVGDVVSVYVQQSDQHGVPLVTPWINQVPTFVAVNATNIASPATVLVDPTEHYAYVANAANPGTLYRLQRTASSWTSGVAPTLTTVAALGSGTITSLCFDSALFTANLFVATYADQPCRLAAGLQPCAQST
jgi:hypothetical protein